MHFWIPQEASFNNINEEQELGLGKTGVESRLFTRNKQAQHLFLGPGPTHPTSQLPYLRSKDQHPFIPATAGLSTLYLWRLATDDKAMVYR